MAHQNLEKKSILNLSVALLAVWGIVLLIAFLANRGDEVGSIGYFLQKLGGGRLFGSGFFENVAGVLVAAVIVAGWFGLGAFLVRAAGVGQIAGESRFSELAVKIALGSAGWSLIWFFLGLAGAYNFWSAVIAAAVGIGLAGMEIWRSRTGEGSASVSETSEGIDWILRGLIAIPLVLAFIASLAPPTAKDTLLYHFSVPKTFVLQGGNQFIEGNIASYLALGTEMHYVWAMLLGEPLGARATEAAAGAVGFAFFPLLLMVVFGWARLQGITRRLALMAVAMTATIPTAFHVAANAYIDLAISLYITLAIFAVTRWWSTLEKRWLFVLAAFLGAALSVKLTALFIFAAIALVITFRAREEKEADDSGRGVRVLASGFAALIIAGIIASPWYLRTWAETGSPVFPFYMNIWPGKAAGWDVERSNLFQAMNSNYGGEHKTPIDFIAAPWNVSVSAQPEQAAYFDGVLGAAFLFGLPVLFAAIWKSEMPTEVKIGSAIAAIMFLFWLFSSQQLRYLLPIVPVLAVAIVTGVQKVSERAANITRVFTIGAAAISAAGILTSAAWFAQKAPLRVVLGGETADEYLLRNIDYYPYYQYLNTQTPVDSAVWLIDMRRDSYHLQRPFFSDYLFEDWTFRQLLWEARSTSELRKKIAELGFSYVLIRHDFLLDFDKTPLLDMAKSKPENEAKLKMAREFILDKENGIRADQRFSLIKIF